MKKTLIVISFVFAFAFAPILLMAVVQNWSATNLQAVSSFYVGSKNVFSFLDGLVNNQTVTNSIGDSTISLRKLTTEAYNFIGAGGSVTNNPDDVTLENVGGSSIGLKENYNVAVDTADLKAWNKHDLADGDQVYYDGSEIGAGEFVYKSSGYTADKGIVFAASGGGYWVRDEWLRNKSVINPEWFGLSTTGSDANNVTAFVNTLAALDNDSTRSIIEIPSHHYKFNGSIVIDDGRSNFATEQGGNLEIRGGAQTILEYTGADSFLVLEYGSKKFLTIKNIKFLGPDSGGASIGIDYTEHGGGIVNLTNVFVRGFGIGFRAHDLTGCNIIGGQFQENGLGIACGYKSDAWNVFGTIITRNTLGVEIGYVNPNQPDITPGNPAPLYAQASNGQLWSGLEINYNVTALKIGGNRTSGIAFKSCYFEWNDTLCVLGHTGSEAEPDAIIDALEFNNCYLNIDSTNTDAELFHFYQACLYFVWEGGVRVGNIRAADHHIVFHTEFSSRSSLHLDLPYGIRIKMDTGETVTPAERMRYHAPLMLYSTNTSFNPTNDYLLSSFFRTDAFINAFAAGRLSNDSTTSIAAKVATNRYGTLDVFEFVDMYPRLPMPTAGAPAASANTIGALAWDTTGAQDILYAYRDNDGAEDRVNLISTLTDAIGGMYCRNESETIAITQFNYAHITDGSNALFAGSELENVEYEKDSLLVNATGKVLLNASVSFSTPTGINELFELAIFKNNGVTNWRAQVHSDSTHIIQATWSGVESNTSGDSYHLVITNASSSVDAVIKAAVLTATMVGD